MICIFMKIEKQAVNKQLTLNNINNFCFDQRRELCAFFTQQANAYKIEYETQFLINQIMKLNIISISNKLKTKKKETKNCNLIVMWSDDS